MKNKAKICDIHGPYEAKILGIFGESAIESPCPICQKFQLAEEEDRKKIIEKAKSVELIKDSGIPKRFLKCTLTNFTIPDKIYQDPHVQRPPTNPTRINDKNAAHAITVAETYLKNFKTRRENGCSLIFCGKPGTGKTHLACAIGLALMRDQIPVRYTTALRAMNLIKATYSLNSEFTEYEILSQYTKPQLLILDEVGVQFGTETEKMLIYQIINGRYENILPTIMISNLSEDELIGYIGERSIDRMREGGGVVVPFDWTSYRK